VVTSTGNGISKLLFAILSAVAEGERDRIRERIADVKRDQKARGRLSVDFLNDGPATRFHQHDAVA